MTNKHKLLPCPFCGETPNHFDETGYVACSKHSCVARLGTSATVDKWNTRAAPTVAGMPEPVLYMNRERLALNADGEIAMRVSLRKSNHYSAGLLDADACAPAFAELTALREENQNLRLQCGGMQMEIDELRVDADSSEKHRNDLASLQGEVTELQKLLDEANEFAGTSQSEIDDLLEENNKLRKERETLRAKNAELEGLLREAIEFYDDGVGRHDEAGQAVEFELWKKWKAALADEVPNGSVR